LFSVAKAKRQLQMFYLRESVAAAAKRPAGTEINPRYADEPSQNKKTKKLNSSSDF